MYLVLCLYNRTYITNIKSLDYNTIKETINKLYPDFPEFDIPTLKKQKEAYYNEFYDLYRIEDISEYLDGESIAYIHIVDNKNNIKENYIERKV